MRYTNTKHEHESDSNISSRTYSITRQNNLMKRLLLMMMVTMFLVFAGAQSTPTTQASETCNLVCGAPFIDPNDGRCYQMCCPENEECKRPCELRPCLK
jgi:hypothetical protein